MAFTKNNKVTSPKYSCLNSSKRCQVSWTYDNHHCNGCHWKGLGVMDISSDESGELENEAKAIEIKLLGLED